MPIVDPLTGEVRTAELFIAVLGASNLTYAEATDAILDRLVHNSHRIALTGKSRLPSGADHTDAAEGDAVAYICDIANAVEAQDVGGEPRR